MVLVEEDLGLRGANAQRHAGIVNAIEIRSDSEVFRYREPSFALQSDGLAREVNCFSQTNLM